jgi:hypothetical protein
MRMDETEGLSVSIGMVFWRKHFIPDRVFLLTAPILLPFPMGLFH